MVEGEWADRVPGRVWAWWRRGVDERSMSYAYLFKYIIIGDTGKYAAVGWMRKMARSGGGSDRMGRFCGGAIDFLTKGGWSGGFSRRRQVLLAAAVHGQAVPAGARPHDWRRVRRAHDQH
jgi:hypothetical protein